MENNKPKVGRIRRGWELTKCSFAVLRKDKSLAVIPLISSLSTAIVFIVIITVGTMLLSLAYLGTASLSEAGHVYKTISANGSSSGWPVLLMVIILYIAMATVGNYFSAAIIFGANQRFNGDDPTIGSSLKGASKKFGPLFNFSLMMTTVGFLLNALERRVPLAGRIAVQLLGAAWSIANVFAIPVIVLSQDRVRPFEATKESVNVIKKVWGESVIADLGIAAIGILSFLLYIAAWSVVGYVGAIIGHIPAGVVGVVVVLAAIGLFALIIVFSALSSIAKAALYYYAVHGKAPELFNNDLLSSSMRKRRFNI